jgi:DNA-binding LacI/PurR family transcriptional regulator
MKRISSSTPLLICAKSAARYAHDVTGEAEGHRGPRPTLSTVAEVAGTSVPTVSKVLRGGTDVSPATRMRVLDAVRAVGYSRRASAALAAPQQTAHRPGMVDLVVNHVEGSWANRVLTGVERVASEADVDVVITLARDGSDWVSRLLRRPSSGAVVVLVDPTSSQFQALAAAHIPVVLVDPMTKPAVEVPSVGVANWDGGRLAAEHLVSLGHRRMGVIAGGRTHVYSRARVDGFRSAVESAEVADAAIHVGYANWDRGLAERETRSMLEHHPDITAVFACSDIMALGVYDALASAGRSIPGDVSVVGFDDVPEAEWARPTLTTIRQPSADMGGAAMRMLLGLVAAGPGAAGAVPRVEMSTELVVRDSTAAPAA